VRLAPFVAFVLVGYFALYAWLRATEEIGIQGWELRDRTFSYTIVTRSDDQRERILHYINMIDVQHGKMPRKNDRPVLPIYRIGEWPWVMRAMWPAVKLEVALDRRGWLPYSIGKVWRYKRA